MTFNEWLEDVSERKFGRSATAFAKAAGLATSTVFSYISGASVPNEGNFIKILLAVQGEIDNEALEDYRRMRQESMDRSMGRKETLCWKCQNAVPTKEKGCSWSRRFVPVDGWLAVPKIHKSYLVVRCPEFVEDDVPIAWTPEQTDLVMTAAEISQDKFEDETAARERRLREKRRKARERYYESRGLAVPTDEEIEAKKRARDARQHRQAYARKKRKEFYKMEVERLSVERSRAERGDGHGET